MATGHLEKRKNGGYNIVIDHGYDDNGKRKRNKIVARDESTKQMLNQKETKKLMVKVLSEVNNGTYVEPSKITVKKYLLQWLKDYCSPNLAPSTYASYQMIINKHLIPNLGHIELDKLHPMHLQGYYSKALLNGRADGKGGLSNRTVQYHHRVLREALNHAVKWQLLKRNVADAVEAPKQKRPEILALDFDEADKFLSVAEETCPELFDIFYTCYHSGMRRGELLALGEADIDFQQMKIHVRKSVIRLPGKGFVFKEPKTRQGKRQIPIYDEKVFKLLKKRRIKNAENKLLHGENYQDYGLIFCNDDGTPIDPSKLNHKFQDIAKKAGFTNFTLHGLRHTHASLLLKLGENPKVVQERLGDSTISVVMDTYSHVLPGIQEQAAKRFAEASKKEIK